MIECPSCSYPVPFAPGERPPPWCPKCGSDLKAGAKPSPAPAPPPPPNPAPVPAAPTHREVVEANGVVYEAPDTEEWTTPEGVFGGNPLYQAAAWVTAAVCLGIAGIAAWQFVHPPQKKVEPGVLYGVIGLFGLGGLACSYMGVRLAGQKYVLYPDRFVVLDGGQETAVRWEQVREVYQAVHPVWTTYRIVTRLGGREFNLSGEIGGHRRLGDAISERVALMLYPAAAEALDAGRSVSFGPMQVSQAGVEVNGELVPWHHILALSFVLNPRPVKGAGSMASNMMHLKLTPGVLVEVGKIPNYKLFAALARKCNPACLTA